MDMNKLTKKAAELTPEEIEKRKALNAKILKFFFIPAVAFLALVLLIAVFTPDPEPAAEQPQEVKQKIVANPEKAAEIKAALDEIIVDYSNRKMFSDFYIQYPTWASLSYKQKEDLIKICANYRMNLIGEEPDKALMRSRIKDYSNNKTLGEFTGFGFKLN